MKRTSWIFVFAFASIFLCVSALSIFGYEICQMQENMHILAQKNNELRQEFVSEKKKNVRRNVALTRELMKLKKEVNETKKSDVEYLTRDEALLLASQVGDAESICTQAVEAFQMQKLAQEKEKKKRAKKIRRRVHHRGSAAIPPGTTVASRRTEKKIEQIQRELDELKPRVERAENDIERIDTAVTQNTAAIAVLRKEHRDDIDRLEKFMKKGGAMYFFEEKTAPRTTDCVLNPSTGPPVGTI